MSGPVENHGDVRYWVSVKRQRNDDRAVVVGYVDDREVFRDTVNTNSSHERTRFLSRFKEAVAITGDCETVLSEIDRQICEASSSDDRGNSLHEPVLVRMSDVQPKNVKWLWDGWLPLGAITVCDAMPGVGKSSLACELTARVTGDGHEVLWLSDEDSPEFTLVPRLMAVNADLTAVHMLTSAKLAGVGEAEPVNLVDHLDAFEDAIQTLSAKLVVIDTLDAYAKDVNLNANTEVRNYLRPIQRIAEQHGVSILFIRHFNKKTGLPALNRGCGSVAIGGAARSVWVVGEHPSEKGVQVLASAKCNIARRPKSKAYRIVPETVYSDTGDAIRTSRIEWICDMDISADDLVNQSRGPGGEKLRACVEFLEELLANGPMRSEDVAAKCKEAGHSDSTVKRARSELGVKAHKEPKFQGEYVLSLPVGEDVAELDADHDRIGLSAVPSVASEANEEHGDDPHCETVEVQ